MRLEKLAARTCAALVFCFLFAACTAVDVKPPAASHDVKEVLIVENPKVWDVDFLQTLEQGFQRHGIKTRVVKEGADLGDEYVVTYVALQKWDMGMYMSDATIKVSRGDVEIAEAVYHLKGGGGLSVFKWQRTKTKIDPVIDELVASLRGTPRT